MRKKPIRRPGLQMRSMEYYAQDRRLNTTMRIKFLFPLLDAAPRDGFVSLKELQTWMMQQTEDNIGYRTANELEIKDKDKDGVITFEEYLPQFSKDDIGACEDLTSPKLKLYSCLCS